MRLLRWTKKIILSHKITAVVALCLLGFIAYWGWNAWYTTNTETHYILSSVEKGTIVATVEGSGQVSGSNEAEIKPKASGDVTYVNVINGQEVQAGTILAQLDATEAQKAVRDAEANLESAKLALQKLIQPADNLSLVQSENALLRAKESKQTAIDNLTQAYDDGFNATSNAFLSLPTVMSGMQDMLYSYTQSLGGTTQSNVDYYLNAASRYNTEAQTFKDDAVTKYQRARTAYDKTFSHYKATSRFSEPAEIEALINESYETTKVIAESVKSTNNLIQLYQDELTKRNLKPVALSDTHLASLNTYTNTTNTHLSSLQGIKNTLTANRTSITNAERTIAETTESLKKLKAGADELDIQSSRLTVTQRENAMLDTKAKLADYTIRAPFNGTLGKFSLKKGDSVSTGTSIATIVSHQQLAELSLNEVDVAKVKVGQKVTLSFDAIADLEMTGRVASIEPLGTVSQGVVTYAVQIAFDTQDGRIKSGMSVSASIITDLKQDVLIIPNGAVKSRGDSRYVEIIDTPIESVDGTEGVTTATSPREQTIEVGLANDDVTEVTSGLQEGDKIISRTITVSKTTTQQTPSILGAVGGNRTNTGGGTRILR
jgi:HlyD family secretion protein